MLRKKRIKTDMKNKIFDKKYYDDCQYENFMIKIYVDHIEKHLYDHKSNTNTLNILDGKSNSVYVNKKFLILFQHTILGILF